MTTEIVNGVLILFIVSVAVFLFWPRGLKRDLRKWIKSSKLRTNEDEVRMSCEFLRQLFLVNHKQYREIDTPEFHKIFNKYLVYKKPSLMNNEEEIDFPDGYFLINPKCRIATPPPPVSHEEPLHPDFVEQ